MRKVRAGDIILYDQGSPANTEINQPGANVGYRATSPTTYSLEPDEKNGLPRGSDLPDLHLDQANPMSSRVIPDSMKTASLISEVLAQVGPDVLAKAVGIKFTISRVLPEKAFWSFAVKGSKGETYSVRLKVFKKGNFKSVDRHHVQVSCNCNFFRWQGPEHWAKANKYLYGKPVGTASRPDAKDPSGKHWACKHVVAVLNRARQYRVASLGLNLSNATVEFAPSAVIVARRFREQSIRRL